MLNQRKLENIAYLAFKNALRLHRDAITLYEARSYPSAFYLSVLAQEEIGKMHIVNDFIFYNFTTGEPRKNIVGIEKFEEEWLGLLYKHTRKQYAFIRNNPMQGQLLFRKGKPIIRKTAQEASDGTFEIKKQEAVYVGLKRIRGKIDAKGKIRHPFQMTKKTAQEQITKINDYFLVMGIGIKYNQYSLDGSNMENELKSKRFVTAIFLHWNHRSISAIRQIRSIQKFFGKETIPL
jgi:AbiV family abortive infection protein